MKHKMVNDVNPSSYQNRQAMDKPLSELMCQLRIDIMGVRDKIKDIEKVYDMKERINHIEGGLTCMLVTMHNVMQQWEEFEKGDFEEIK